MKCRIIFPAALSACFAAFAGDVETVFPSAGGDLASAADWGGALPGTDAHLVLNQAGTYTLSSAAEFASIRQNVGGDVVFDFTGAPGPLTLNDRSTATGSDGSIFCFPYDYKTASTTLKGGTWYGSGKYSFNPVGLGKNYFSGDDIYNDYTFTMTNGCVVTNVSSVTIANRIGGFDMTIADRSKIFSGGNMTLTANAGTDTEIQVTSGAELHAKGVIYSDGDGTEGMARDLLFDVQGTDTKVCAEDSVYLGFKSSRIHFRVRGAAVLEAANNIEMSMFTVSRSNTLEVLNGGIVKTGGCLKMRTGCENRLSVSNATLNVGGILYLSGSVGFHDGADVSAESVDPSGVSMVISGEGTVFTNRNGKSLLSGGFLNNGRNVLVLKDGYEDKRPVEFGYMHSPSNLFVITSGAVFDRSSEGHEEGIHSFLGYGASGIGSRDNRVEITDGGVFKADSFYVCGSNNTVVVSNGTLIAGNQTNKLPLWFGYANGTATGSDSVTLVLAGTNPVVRCLDPGDTEYGGVALLTMQNNSVLRYDIPEAGYAAGHVPFISRINTIAGATLEVNCDEWSAAGGLEGNKLVLFRSPSPLPDHVVGIVEACAGTLPPGVTLSVRGGDIVLRRPGSGYRIILR